PVEKGVPVAGRIRQVHVGHFAVALTLHIVSIRFDPGPLAQSRLVRDGYDRCGVSTFAVTAHRERDLFTGRALEQRENVYGSVQRMTVDGQYRVAFSDIDACRCERRDKKWIPAIAVIDLLDAI